MKSKFLLYVLGVAVVLSLIFFCGVDKISVASPQEKPPRETSVKLEREKKPSFAIDFQALKARAEGIKRGEYKVGIEPPTWRREFHYGK